MTRSAGAGGSTHARAVLERRARELARPARTPAWGRPLELMRFAAGGERCAIEAAFLHHVFRLRSVSLLPGADPPVAAVVPWRGQILPVLDLPQLLRLPATGDAAHRFALVVGADRPAFALLADDLPEPMTLVSGRLRPPAPGAPARAEVIEGVTDDGVLVLDARELIRIHG